MIPSATIDKVTFWLFIGFWPIWLVWELILVKLRGHDPSVDLISMVAKNRAYQMSAIAFTWGSFAAHYWLNWKSLPWSTPIPAVIFWILLVVVLVWDITLWGTPYYALPFWMRCVRWPATMLFLGLLNGLFLFPQRGSPVQPF